MKKINQLAIQIDNTIDGVTNDSIAPTKAKAFVSVVNVKLSEIRLRLAYAKARNEKPNIPFMNSK